MSALATQRGAALDEKQSYLADYEALSRDGAAAPDWLRALRENAIGAFRESRFPTTKDEDWKYTSVAPLVQVPFRTASPTGAVGKAELIRRAAPSGATHLVFVNGRFARDLSSPDEGHVASALSAAPPDRVRPQDITPHSRARQS